MGASLLRFPRTATKLILGKLRSILGRQNQHEGQIDPALVSFAQREIDGNAYLTRHRDVADAKVEPHQHWLENGIAEGRWFNDDYSVTLDDGPTGSALMSFRWKGLWANISARQTMAAKPVTAAAPQATTERNIPDALEAEFREFITAHFDSGYYLAANPDVRAAKAEPLQHFLRHGVFEERRPAPGVIVHVGRRHATGGASSWMSFNWRGRALSVRCHVLPEAVRSQVLAQSEFDPAVAAIGHTPLSNAAQHDAIDVGSRAGLDVTGFAQDVPTEPDAILIVSFLGVGGAEKYAADIAQGLQQAGRKEVLVIVTEQESEQASGWEDLAILAPLPSCNVVFWRDYAPRGGFPPATMARVLAVLRAKDIIVVNSGLGLRVLERYARGLSHYSRLHAAFFSFAPPALGLAYASIFPRRIAPFARLLTDNSRARRVLDERYSPLQGPGTFLLPPQVTLADDSVFDDRMSKRLTRATNRRLQWVWISRIEPFKGTELLGRIASLRPGDDFHLFGPLAESLAELDLDLKNISYDGVISDLSSADLSEYDGFIFTSCFEGMPNIVLEVSQHAIPMVLTDVGGLRDTFDDDSVAFVPVGEESGQVAAEFSAALGQIASMEKGRLTQMLRRARQQVCGRHGTQHFQHLISELFNA